MIGIFCGPEGHRGIARSPSELFAPHMSSPPAGFPPTGLQPSPRPFVSPPPELSPLPSPVGPSLEQRARYAMQLPHGFPPSGTQPSLQPLVVAPPLLSPLPTPSGPPSTPYAPHPYAPPLSAVAASLPMYPEAAQTGTACRPALRTSELEQARPDQEARGRFVPARIADSRPKRFRSPPRSQPQASYSENRDASISSSKGKNKIDVHCKPFARVSPVDEDENFMLTDYAQQSPGSATVIFSPRVTPHGSPLKSPGGSPLRILRRLEHSSADTNVPRVRLDLLAGTI